MIWILSKSMLKICHISNFWSQIKKVLLPKNYRLLFNTIRDFLLLDIYNSALFSAPTKAIYFLSEKILNSTEIYCANLDISRKIFCFHLFQQQKYWSKLCHILYFFGYEYFRLAASTHFLSHQHANFEGYQNQREGHKQEGFQNLQYTQVSEFEKLDSYFNPASQCLVIPFFYSSWGIMMNKN